MAEESTNVAAPNSPEARTETGEIKDVTPTSLASGSSPTQTSPEDTKPSGSLATEAKAETKPEETKTDDKKPDAPVVPEKYEFKAPEGFEFDAERVKEADGLFRELGLTQEQANKVMELAGKEIIAAAEEPYNAYQTIRESWRKDVISDSALGDGQSGLNAETQAAVGRAKAALGPELRAQFEEAMNFTGAGDHPAFLRAIVAWSKQVGEGRPVTNITPPNSGERKPSVAQAIYPNLPSAAR